MSSLAVLLSAIIFLPAIGGLVLAFIPGHQKDVIRWTTLGITIAVVVLCGFGFFATNSPGLFDISQASMQNAVNLPWIPSFDIDYFLGVDGISFPLVILTAVITALSMGASWPIEKHVKAYCILFLLLLTGMLGVFMSLDFFLFYVFWEVMLLPMYFLIGVWGGPRKEYAAIKFFLYTLVGSVLMLIAILMLYFNSDLRVLAEKDAAGQLNVPWSDLHIGSAANARLGRTEANGLLLMRNDAATTDQPLQIEFEPSDVATTAAYDDATRTVTVRYVADATTADVSQAISESDTAQTVVTARAVKGDDRVGAG